MGKIPAESDLAMLRLLPRSSLSGANLAARDTWSQQHGRDPRSKKQTAAEEEEEGGEEEDGESDDDMIDPPDEEAPARALSGSAGALESSGTSATNGPPTGSKRQGAEG